MTALPEIDGAYTISAGKAIEFERKGHVKLESVLARQEIAAYRDHLKNAVERGGGKRNCNVWVSDEPSRKFVTSPRLARVAADLLGVDDIRLLRDEPYFKNREDFNTPWHQDAFFIPLDTPKILTLWIPLTDMNPEMAPMSYFDGSHKAGFLGLCGPGDESMSAFENNVSRAGYRVSNYGSFAAGDLAVHAGQTLHCSGRNRSDRLREVIIILYFADGARVTDSSKLPPGGPPLEVILPGLRPGDPAAGPLTPLVFSRNRVLAHKVNS
jgi:hypothetical protein